MATIAQTSLAPAGGQTVSETTLGASDTFTYNKKSYLILRNATGGALTPVIDGDGGTVVGVAGVGDVDVSSGYSFGSIGAGVVVGVSLDTVSKYLAGTIAVTGGTGIVAVLINT